MTDYLVYDVFTSTAFGGNPLAVIPDATNLAEADLLTIAREFNFSETTFVFPPSSADADAKVRIFTPTRELAFAGHPTVGTAIALSELGRVGADMVLELGVGPIPVSVSGTRAMFKTRVPLETAPGPSLAAIAACLGLSDTQIRTDNHLPEFAGLGTDFVLAELCDTGALNQASPVIDAFRTAASDPGRLAIFLYVRDGEQIEARMFAPLGGILEDPATGSACAAMAAYLGKLDQRSQSFEISQGVAMGRPSRINATVTIENGTPVEVSIAGSAVRVMEGRLTVATGCKTS